MGKKTEYGGTKRGSHVTRARFKNQNKLKQIKEK
jgi:hypothetical protein